eukprot:1245709-Rhodomonas_salina.1
MEFPRGLSSETNSLAETIPGCKNCKFTQAELAKTIPDFPNVQVDRKIRPCSACVKTLDELAENILEFLILRACLYRQLVIDCGQTGRQQEPGHLAGPERLGRGHVYARLALVDRRLGA